MLDGSTIVARATPPGASARAVIRLSGPRTGELLHALFDAPPHARGARPSRLRLAPGFSLPVLLARYAGPASYTGEDAAEVALPGNPALIERILTLLTAHDGVRLARPGEFTARAHLSGKLALHQAEGVAALIAARTDKEWRAAQSLLRGRSGAVYHRWSDELASILALLEAGLDFADQEGVTAISHHDARARLASLRADIAAHLARAAGAEAPAHAPRVALAGVPNAGKSTLFNALLGRRRAVESPAPGTTRDALAETLHLAPSTWGGSLVTLVDLPGLDTPALPSAPNDSAAAARAAALAHLHSADVIVYCDPAGRFDATLPPGPTAVRVRTKADRPAPRPTPDCIPVCALDGWNLPAVVAAIASASAAAPSPADPAPRHRHTAARALASIDEALAELQAPVDSSDRPAPRSAEPVTPTPARPPDEAVIADLLRRALDTLGELTGLVTPDDLLGRIFAAFCIGK